MTNELRQGAANVVQDPKIAGSVMGMTAVTGFSDTFMLIPWGAVASCVGSVLSITLGIIQIWRFILDREKRLAEIKILEHKIHEE